MKFNKRNTIILFFLIIFCFPIIAFANEELIVPKLTEEYKNWLELPEEEKQCYIEPQAYEVENEVSGNKIKKFSADINSNVGASNLPQIYKRKYYGTVKNQGSTNTCWVYSAISMFDTNYYLINNLTKKFFSNIHMDYITSYQYNKNGFNRKVNSGGNVQVALAYATNGMGIPLESSMPSVINSSSILSTKNSAKVSDYIELQGQNQIKDYIYKYGVVPIFTYKNDSDYFSSGFLYNNTDLAYCCTNSKQAANHAVTLIGWDDTYTNESFPSMKGAYIALNSYGTIFGNNGLYYIFYNDTFVKGKTYGATKTTDINYDYIYQHDPYGCTGTGGYSTGTYVANVFKRKESNYIEKLTEISSYFPSAGNVTIYINSQGTDVKVNSATQVINTYISQAGYHTIKLNNEIQLKNNEFTIGIKYPGLTSLELPTPNGWCSTVTSNLGESYISRDGVDYDDIHEIFSDYDYPYANGCIKAFTKRGAQISTEYSGDLINYVFDYRYYAEHNPDLYAAFGYDENNLRNHWNTYGKAEGRVASYILDLNYYASKNPDLVNAFGYNYISLYNHFMNFGFKEYRNSSPEYDGAYYREHNSDLKNMTSMELIRHYSQFGRRELRRANNHYEIQDYLFNPQLYMILNPDVANAFGNNEYLLRRHWYLYGISEGRIASLIFDARYYLNNNKDVAKVYSSTNYRGAYNHFINYGFDEGRQGNAIFSVDYYLSKNIDLKNSFGKNYLFGLNHYINNGKKEGRLTSSKFNISIYRANNIDLQKVFGKDDEQYLIHYLQFGQYENRCCI